MLPILCSMLLMLDDVGIMIRMYKGQQTAIWPVQWPCLPWTMVLWTCSSTHVLAQHRKYDEVPQCPQSPWPAPWPAPWLGLLPDASHGRSIYLSLFTYWSTLASLEPAVLQCCSLDGPQPRHRSNQVPALSTIRQSVSTCNDANDTTYTHLKQTFNRHFFIWK